MRPTKLEIYTRLSPGRSAFFGQFYRFYCLKYIQCRTCDVVATDNRLSLKIRAIKDVRTESMNEEY